jgi:hypothetical protein
VVLASSTLGLAIFGAVGAALGGASMLRGAIRVIIGGLIAMGVGFWSSCTRLLQREAGLQPAGFPTGSAGGYVCVLRCYNARLLKAAPLPALYMALPVHAQRCAPCQFPAACSAGHVWRWAALWRVSACRIAERDAEHRPR